MTAPWPNVPHRLASAAARRPLIEVAPGRALVRFPGVGRILVTDEGVFRQPDPGRAVDGLMFLDDVANALAGLLVGRFSLRAAAVEIDGCAVALCGAGPVGKSTIASALWMRGHRFVGDAVATVTMLDGKTIVHGARRGPILWPDAVERLGLDPADGVSVRPSLPVRRFAVVPGSDTVPLGTVVVLRRGHDGDEEPTPVTGFDAVERLARGCWHRFAISPLGLTAAHFAWATELARRVRVVALDVPRRDADPQVLADAVLRCAVPIGSES